MWHPFKRFRSVQTTYFYGKSIEEAKAKLEDIQKIFAEEVAEEWELFKEEGETLHQFLHEYGFFVASIEKFAHDPHIINLMTLKDCVDVMEKQLKKIKNKNIKIEHLICLTNFRLRATKRIIDESSVKIQ